MLYLTTRARREIRTYRVKFDHVVLANRFGHFVDESPQRGSQVGQPVAEALFVGWPNGVCRDRASSFAEQLDDVLADLVFYDLPRKVVEALHNSQILRATFCRPL